MNPIDVIPRAWQPRLAKAGADPEFARTLERVDRERRDQTVYPPADRTFAALELTPPADIRVVILGQDPYHGAGHATGSPSQSDRAWQHLARFETSSSR